MNTSTPRTDAAFRDAWDGVRYCTGTLREEMENLVRDAVSSASVNKTEWKYLTATADQRAEAFLKTLDLWQE
jgi:hypothetical protein